MSERERARELRRVQHQTQHKCSELVFSWRSHRQGLHAPVRFACVPHGSGDLPLSHPAHCLLQIRRFKIASQPYFQNELPISQWVEPRPTTVQAPLPLPHAALPRRRGFNRFNASLAMIPMSGALVHLSHSRVALNDVRIKHSATHPCHLPPVATSRCGRFSLKALLATLRKSHEASSTFVAFLLGKYSGTELCRTDVWEGAWPRARRSHSRWYVRANTMIGNGFGHIMPTSRTFGRRVAHSVTPTAWITETLSMLICMQSP